METNDSTNPGLVNVADEADGETKINQAIEVTTPSYNAGPTVDVTTEKLPGRGLASNNTDSNAYAYALQDSHTDTDTDRDANRYADENSDGDSDAD